jgi:hypothetical protein
MAGAHPGRTARWRSLLGQTAPSFSASCRIAAKRLSCLMRIVIPRPWCSVGRARCRPWAWEAARGQGDEGGWAEGRGGRRPGSGARGRVRVSQHFRRASPSAEPNCLGFSSFSGAYPRQFVKPAADVLSNTRGLHRRARIRAQRWRRPTRQRRPGPPFLTAPTASRRPRPRTFPGTSHGEESAV